MAYNMSDEEKLARDLASRGVSRFTEVSGGPSYNLCGYIFGVGVLFLLLHVGAFFNIYAVQFSRFSGNYAETKATVVSHSSQREYVYHINSFPKDHDFPKKHNDKLVEVSEVTTYYIKAVGDDGTEFNFEGSANYGKKGSRLRIKYSKSNPENYYVATNLSHMPSGRSFGLVILVFAVLAFLGAYAVFRWKRKCQMDVERKGIQSYQSLLYVRFLCFGNGALTALHDRSDGFFRRQIVITTKDKPEGRVDDPYLVEKMIAEKEGIFLWCLEGLKRLVANDYRFTISERSKDNINAIVKDANNILEFLASEGYLTFHEDSKAATSDLYTAYKEWCEDNAENALSMKSFANFLSQYAENWHLVPDNNIYRGKGKRCRGYRGVEVIDHDNPFLE